MSALRIAAKQHTRTLSQPLRRRTFYTPYAALQHSPLTNPTATATTATATVIETAPAAAHEHEHEHAARTVYVVAEPNAADFQFYGVPAGAYPVATPYTAENANINVRLLLIICCFPIAHCERNFNRHRRREHVSCCAPRLFLDPERRGGGERGARGGDDGLCLVMMTRDDVVGEDAMSAICSPLGVIRRGSML
jgi:hypothetical protein